ncbi:MAG: hypothetical protein KJ884_03125 [Gammaproteobacteria bacterium]|nr:hypothetical protein [Gammaproteobacteria bacterium]MBU2140242.1 hypothetical protein [Gammaproteobacteria bacterium]MBU2217203.1 hypothetical protein [Gammaproteobacteria bacterium]MBU2321932.1 hypothetical protein [Gammaproteobacteria bacterium]
MSLKLMLTAAIGFLLTGCAVYGDTYDSRYRSYDRGYAQSYYYSPPPQRIYQPVYVVPRHDRYDDRRRYYDDRRRYGAHAYRPAPHRYVPAPHYQGGKRHDDRRHHNAGRPEYRPEHRQQHARPQGNPLIQSAPRQAYDRRSEARRY